MRNDSYIVIEASNLKSKGKVTTLAWDIGKKISEILTFKGEIIINWISDKENQSNGTYGYGYDHSYCLVFQNKD